MVTVGQLSHVCPCHHSYHVTVVCPPFPVLLGLHDISSVAVSLDVKIMVNMWKTISRSVQSNRYRALPSHFRLCALKPLNYTAEPSN